MDKRVLMCWRVADVKGAPIVQSRIATCEHCGHAAWVADSSPEADTILCIPCGVAEMNRTGVTEIEPPTKEQLADIESLL